MKHNRALIIGRFQPFHNGHLALVKKAFEDTREVVIGIGSAQASHTPDNPFTAGERFEMIAGALKGAKMTDFFVVPIEDMHRCGLWVAHVANLLPKFDVYYSNNPIDIRLFKEAGMEVRETGLFEREHFAGVELRRMMIEGGEWRRYVPPEVAHVIDDIDGIARLRAITHGDMASSRHRMH